MRIGARSGYWYGAGWGLDFKLPLTTIAMIFQALNLEPYIEVTSNLQKRWL